ncbi:MAG: precorrin-3B C(17)-methyltransferase [Alphaproteobacteria bacterium]|nr:precorrin-3B C(17)-methyltransferase [Alphaproteobacteria bacterium]
MTAPNAGRLFIIGLGPGHARLRTHEADAALAKAQDIFGYYPYLDRIDARPGQIKHPSDNREELDRAKEALVKVVEGRNVAIVSGGDAGVFAMAAAVFEAIESGAPSWRELEIEVIPGVSAMHAAAGRLGAPLGNDFCAISLSTNLKPWTLIEKRLQHAVEGDFVIALYNPASMARPDEIYQAFDLLTRLLPADRLVCLAKNIGRDSEECIISKLSEVEIKQINMSTLVLIGSSGTRSIPHAKGSWIYTSRGAK